MSLTLISLTIEATLYASGLGCIRGGARKTKNTTIQKNTVKKLTTLLNIIGPPDDIGYLEDNEANNDYGMVNNWITNIVDKKIYPSKDTLILANKLWKKYYFRLPLDEAETIRYILK